MLCHEISGEWHYRLTHLHSSHHTSTSALKDVTLSPTKQNYWSCYFWKLASKLCWKMDIVWADRWQLGAIDIYFPQVSQRLFMLLSPPTLNPGLSSSRSKSKGRDSIATAWNQDNLDLICCVFFSAPPQNQFCSDLRIGRIVVSLSFYPDNMMDRVWADSCSFLNACLCSTYPTPPPTQTQRVVFTSKRWIFMIIQLRLNTGSFSVGQREANDSIVSTHALNISTAVLSNYTAIHPHTRAHTHMLKAGVFRHFTIEFDYKSGDCDTITRQFSIHPSTSKNHTSQLNPSKEKPSNRWTKKNYIFALLYWIKLFSFKLEFWN